MLNHITVQGYFGRDPEITEREGQNGKYKVASFSIGCGRDFGDDTDWFYCTMYGKRAEVIEKWFQKGSEIIVSGRMESYKPKKDPNRTAWLIKVEDFHFTKNGTATKTAAPKEVEPDEFMDSFEAAEEDIPFG